MANASVTKKEVVVKKLKNDCILCGKGRCVIRTACCYNWICEDNYNRRDGYYGCDSDHRKSCCFKHSDKFHEGKWQDCKECMDLGDSEYDVFQEFSCINCGFKSKSTECFAYQINDDFCCTEEECRAKFVRPTKSTEKKVEIKKVKKACRLCNRTRRLTKTECCNNWICDDEDKYVMFSFDLNSCYRNHSRYSLCSYHHGEEHSDNWRDCEECKKHKESLLLYGGEFDFDEVTCVSCNFKSDILDEFAYEIKKSETADEFDDLFEMDFYCKKDECQAKCKPPPSKRTKDTVEVKEASRDVKKKKKNLTYAKISKE